MEEDKFQNFREKEYKGRIDWYDRKAAKNKLAYLIFQWIALVLSVSVPVLITTLENSWQLVTIILSILLAIATSALKTFGFQENWLNYRTTAESLKKEEHFFDAGLFDYAEPGDKERVFVRRVEALTSQESTKWLQIHEDKEKPEQKEGEE
jgi:hypothetical protein